MVNFKKKWDKPFSQRIAKRVAKIPTNDLFMWADQTIVSLARSLSTYERGRTQSNLDELTTGAEALHALVHEIEKRTGTSF